MTAAEGTLLSRARDIFFENLALKVLSFAFALGLYTFIHGAQDAQRTFPLDVVANTPPPGLHRVLVTQIPPVRVTLRGSRALLDDLDAAPRDAHGSRRIFGQGNGERVALPGDGAEPTAVWTTPLPDINYRAERESALREAR